LVCQNQKFYFEKINKLIYNDTGMKMSDETIKRIPYGLSDYQRISQQNYYYVDKTGYLETIEKAGEYLFFIRPRRFGKSLFLTMMQGYYDIAYKDQFEELFKDTAIFRHPTPGKNAYLVLKLNFSLIDPDTRHIEKSFLYYIRERSEYFLHKYRTCLGIDELQLTKEKEKIDTMNSPSDILRILFNFCRSSSQKLYVMIDEYDNFSNTILTNIGKKEYRELTHGPGFFKTFFNVVKGETTDIGAAISRLFITGVSPVTMDDVTSGFNIGKNISIEADFNRMLGFTLKDVAEMIEYYRQNGLIEQPAEYLLDIMNPWYNNYLFSKKSKTTLFNSDMVLYFIDKCIRTHNIPDQLIDQNVRIDYGKLRYFITIDSDKGRATNGNFNRLREIIEKGEIDSPELIESFSVEKLADTKNFLSLLFYFGLLTVKKSDQEEPVLKIPNETVKRLFYDYINEAYEETETFAIDCYDYSRLVRGMAYRGEWKPLFDYLAQRMQESMSLRDLIRGEASIKAFLNVYLGLDQRYIIHTEKEMNTGFADIVLEPFLARYKEIKYSYILEIKYLKKGEQVRKDGNKVKERKADKIDKLIIEAEEQLKKYSIDEKFRKTIGSTSLIKLVLIFSGPELKYIAEVS
jgi:hypothetical protein